MKPGVVEYSTDVVQSLYVYIIILLLQKSKKTKKPQQKS